MTIPITGLTCPSTIHFKFITKCDNCYYKVRQLLLQSAMVCYYKVRRLLQNATEHTVSLNGNPIVNNITENLTVLNQNVKETKRERFAMFANSIVDNLCLPYCSSINGAKYDCCDFKIIDAPYNQI